MRGEGKAVFTFAGEIEREKPSQMMGITL